MWILASTSVPFRSTTVQMPNLALIETKRITVSSTVVNTENTNTNICMYAGEYMVEKIKRETNNDRFFINALYYFSLSNLTIIFLASINCLTCNHS